MRFAVIFIFAFLASCNQIRRDPSFDIEAKVMQHSVDPSKGIHLVIYPVDREGER